MNKKHAYLILAHNDVPLLERLIGILDDGRNDIYVHWDAKSGTVPVLRTKNAHLYVLNKRIKVNWAGLSMVKAEIALFKEACKNGPYAYYHLLSGADLPIKSQDYIHQECERMMGTEFIAFADAPQSEIDYRVQHFFLFPEKFKDAGIVKKALRFICLTAQNLDGYKRTDVTVKKGSQWCSVTQAFVEYLLSKEADVLKLFDHTFCPDELFVQTVCVNSPFMDKVRQVDSEFEGNLRFIKWVDGELLPITMKDVPALQESDRWFARKFSSKDEALLNEIKEMVNG